MRWEMATQKMAKIEKRACSLQSSSDGFIYTMCLSFSTCQIKDIVKFLCMFMFKLASGISRTVEKCSLPSSNTQQGHTRQNRILTQKEKKSKLVKIWIKQKIYKDKKKYIVFLSCVGEVHSSLKEPWGSLYSLYIYISSQLMSLQR